MIIKRKATKLQNQHLPHIIKKILQNQVCAFLRKLLEVIMMIIKTQLCLMTNILHLENFKMLLTI